MTRNEIMNTLQHMPAGAQWLIFNHAGHNAAAEKLNAHTIAITTGRDTFRYSLNQAATIIYQNTHA